MLLGENQKAGRLQIIKNFHRLGNFDRLYRLKKHKALIIIKPPKHVETSALTFVEVSSSSISLELLSRVELEDI